MQHLIHRDDFDLKRFAKSLERNAQEAVKWERRKLEWILEERAKKLESELKPETDTV